MKVFYNNCAYIHLKDLAKVISNKQITMPSSMYMTYVGLDKGKNSLVVDDSNSFDYRIFRNPEEIDFFKGLDWILDLSEVEHMSADELEGFKATLIRNKQNYKAESVAAFLDYRQGRLNMKFPEGVYVKKWVDDSSPKGLKGLLSRAFGKK